MSTVKLYVDNHNQPVYPGQTISGRVECNFTEQKNLRAVRVKFKGRAECEWNESESYYDSSSKSRKTRTVHYSAEEAYFDAEYNLVHGGENFSLPAGRHVYPFSYILPPQLPSSFEGTYGNVRYYIKAVVDRPWKFDYEDKVFIGVVSPLDLNFVSGAREPVAISVDKTFCSCWCNDTGALTFNISLPCRGFVPGQEVDVGAYVENMSNVSADLVIFKIVKEIEYITHHPRTHHRYDETIVAECTDGGIGAHGQKSWTSKLIIPACSLPNMIPCSIINITYTLKAKVVVPCPHSNLKSEARLLIGTVPLTGVTTTFSQGPPPTLPPPSILPPIEGPTFGFTNGTPNAAPYPNAPNIEFPNSVSPPYPGPPAPYPGDAPYSGSAPYPSGGTAFSPGSAPYPPTDKSPSAAGEAPYPGGTPFSPGSAPYPPTDKSPSAPGEAPYPGATPYPSGGPSAPGAPYPPSGPSSSGTYPGPPGPGVYPAGGVPYPLAGKVPYPPSSDARASAPLAGGELDPFPATEGAPPSYSEAEKLLEKK